LFFCVSLWSAALCRRFGFSFVGCVPAQEGGGIAPHLEKRKPKESGGKTPHSKEKHKKQQKAAAKRRTPKRPNTHVPLLKPRGLPASGATPHPRLGIDSFLQGA
jgi:hypothetical protein